MPQDVKDLIERDIKSALDAAGLLPQAIDLALPALKRDGITYDEKTRASKGVKEAVAALKAQKPSLFGAAGYRDTTKSIDEIENARDMKRFGQRAADLY
jgi:hypothetical protein